jgi:hypothetical protein
MTDFPYPMWAVTCERCGYVGTRWEKPGTAGSYVEFCAGCGESWPDVEKVESGAEHKAVATGEEVDR